MTGVDGNTFTIDDPAYPDRTTRNACGNSIEARGYVTDPTNDLSELFFGSTPAGKGGIWPSGAPAVL